MSGKLDDSIGEGSRVKRGNRSELFFRFETRARLRLIV
jgi:hypothetical protein